MTDVSPELNQFSTNKDQIRSGKRVDMSVKERLKKVAGKVVLGTPLAALLMSSGNIDNPNAPLPNISEPTPASAPLPKNTSHNIDTLQMQTPTVSPQTSPSLSSIDLNPDLTETPERTTMTEEYMQQKLIAASEKFSQELKLAGIDIHRDVTLNEIKGFAKEAIPYLKKELQIEKVNIPPISRGEGNYYKNYNIPFLKLDRIKIGGGPLYMKRVTIIHELVHAQRETKPANGKWIVSPREEEFAEIVAWEVLADQALNGDLLAKYTLADQVLCKLNAQRRKNEVPSCFGNSGYKPITLVMDALNGRSTTYGNVKLYGLVVFIKKDILITDSD